MPILRRPAHTEPMPGLADEGPQVILIGIDPGHTTGYAEWCLDARKLIDVRSGRIDEVMEHVLMRASIANRVIFEDARLRKWLGGKGIEALQGAGSIKRDCTIWAEFLGARNIPYHAIAPQKGATKWAAPTFAKATGWLPRTNEHGRDAALLVYGRMGYGTK